MLNTALLLVDNFEVMTLPELIVFDLDYTLWPFWVDTHVQPPFLMDSYGRVFDAKRKEIRCYVEVPRMLEHLFERKLKMALASRTGSIRDAETLVKLFGWDEYFSYRQIFPGDKQTHFQKIHAESGIDFNKMIFFDDERRNINSVSSLGVTSVLVESGMNMALLEQGMGFFHAQRSMVKFYEDVDF